MSHFAHRNAVTRTAPGCGRTLKVASDPTQTTARPGEDMPGGWVLSGPQYYIGAAFTFEQANYLFAHYPMLQLVVCISAPRAKYVTCAAHAHRVL
jgi:hypothetical protein